MSIQKLINDIRNCKVCEKHLPLGANPIISGSANSKILIIGQAPGVAVHQTSIPWNDKSGDNIRTWMDMDRDTFYNEQEVALMPMGFCYPGTGKSGDLPPRPECAPLWHASMIQQMPNIQLILLVGQYAQNYYLKDKAKSTLTETVQNFTSYLPQYFPLPHPSPRNNIWQAKNPWFKEEVLPALKKRIQQALKGKQ